METGRSYDWHGEIKFCVMPRRLTIIKNLLSLYEQHIEWTPDDNNMQILSCKSTWTNIYILASNLIVRIPWVSSFSIYEDVLIYDLSKNLGDDSDWRKDLALKLFNISTLPILDESEHFAHLGLKIEIEKISPDKSIEAKKSGDQISEERRPPAVNDFLIDCIENCLYVIQNTFDLCKLVEFKENNVKLFEKRIIPFDIGPKDLKIRQISCGKMHTMLLGSNGTVYTFGNGTRGELGHGSTDCLQAPKLVEALIGLKIRRIAAGGWHSAALTEFGDVYVWGWNADGQLGIDKNKVTVVTEPTFMQIGKDQEENDDVNVINIACGSRFSVFLTDKRDAYVCGYLDYRNQIVSSNSSDSQTTIRKIDIAHGQEISDIIANDCCCRLFVNEK